MVKRYLARGVEVTKKDVHNAVNMTDKGLFPNSFCKIVPDFLTGNNKNCIVMHADGAGTKASLAYIYWKETGDISVWKGIVQDAVVMNIDDLLCVGVTGEILLSSTIGRNRKFIPGEVVSALISGMEEFIEEMRILGIRLRSTGGETADVGDLVRTLIVDVTAVCTMKRSEVIENHIRSGDVIIGLASYGKTTYEKEYNSGIGSNGLTSARHDLFHHSYKNKYPESFDPEIPDKLAYSGTYKLTDTIGKLALSPTRTYTPVLIDVFKRYRQHIHGIIHCTGGGQTKVLNFIRNLHVVKDNLFAPPPVFNMIREQSGTQWKEMYQVFNMGHRMEIYTTAKIAGSIISIAADFDLDARIIGGVEKNMTKKLSLITNYGKFVFH